jgi:hypothetical protein
MSMSLTDDSLSYFGSPLYRRSALIFLYLTVVLNRAVLALLGSCFYSKIREFILSIRIPSARARFYGLLNSDNWWRVALVLLKPASKRELGEGNYFLRVSLLRFLLQFSIRELFNSSMCRGKRQFMFSGEDELKNGMPSERSSEFITQRLLITC